MAEPWQHPTTFPLQASLSVTPAASIIIVEVFSYCYCFVSDCLLVTQFDYKDKKTIEILDFLFIETFPEFAIFHSRQIANLPEFAINKPKTVDFIVKSAN
jgi:hypothetical protein